MKSEVELRNYKFVLKVPAYGRIEEIDRMAEEIQKILSTRLHNDGVVVESWEEMVVETGGEHTFVLGVDGKWARVGTEGSEGDSNGA